jgi:L-fuculose-phosphate aldolase
MIPKETRVAIVAACKRLEAGGLVAGSSGNVSVRLAEEDRYAITPSGVPYRILQPAQIVEIDGEGKLVEGTGKASSEKLAHLTAYRQRADVNAVIHSHSIYAGALALANMELPPVIDEMVVALGGAVQVADYHLPATQDLADKAIDALGLRAAVLMRNHGAIGVGRDLDEALAVVEMLERSAKIYYLARLLGGEVQPLPEHVWQMEAKFFRIQHGLPPDG